MDTIAFQKVTTSAAEITKAVVDGQAQIFDIYAKNAEGMPISSFFSAVASLQRETLKSFEDLAGSLNVASASNGSKKPASAKKSVPASAPLKAATKVAKKVVDAQADALVGASASTIAVTTKTTDAIAKAATSAVPGAVPSALDDLTVVSGIGPSTMKKLQAEGIRTLSDLAAKSSKELTAIVEKANVRMLKNVPSDWIAEAKSFVKAAKKA